jgi:hypothetical protein
VLNEIVACGEADVVVSSTWRYGKTAPELQEILDAEGFKGCVLDKTPTGVHLHGLVHDERALIVPCALHAFQCLEFRDSFSR